MTLEKAARASPENPAFLVNPNYRDFLTVADCSPVSDGASAVVLASEDALRALGRPAGEAVRKIESPEPAPPAGLDAAIRAYLTLGESLAKDRAVDEAQVQALVQAAKANGGEAVATAVEHMCCVPLKEQRERYKKVSEAMIARWQQGGATLKLYLIRCPMAEARWIQESDKIANPYLDAAGRGCGEVMAR